MNNNPESNALRLLLRVLVVCAGVAGIIASSNNGEGDGAITTIVQGLVTNTVSGQGEEEVDVELKRPLTSPTGQILATLEQLTIPPGESIATTRTNADGSYQFSDVPADDTYFLTYTKDGFIDEAYFEVTIEPETFLILEHVPLLATEFDTSTGIISGAVHDAATFLPLSDVRIKARAGIDNRSGAVLLEDASSDSGLFSLAFLDAGNYTLEVTLTGYQTAYFDALVLNADQNPDTADETTLGRVALVPDELADVSFPVSGIVFAAYNNAFPGSPGPPFPLSGAAVRVREGSNTTVGTITTERFTDTTGFYSISSLLAGQYTIEGALSGFNSGYADLTVGRELFNQNVTLLPPPPFDNPQQITIVLTWGNATNLDGQLTQVVPGVDPVPSLNDDTDGFGPETTIVPDNTDRLFEYFVKDLSRIALGLFTAQVRVYRGNNLIFTFEPPLNDEDAGLAMDWHVFSIDGDQILPVNDFVVGPDINIDNASAFEGSVTDQPLDFAVSLNSTSSFDTVLEMVTIDGTATVADDDYRASNFLYSTNGGDTWVDATGPNGTIVTIPADSNSILVRVFAIADTRNEPTETFTLGVSRVIFGVVNNFFDTGTGTIIQDEIQ